MPILISPKVESLQMQTSSCSFHNPAQNEFTTQQVTMEELKERCDRYAKLLASLQPPQDATMIRAANFTTDSVLQMLQQYPGSTFIRVYYGIDEAGNHLLFMAPVPDSESQIAQEDTIYVDGCCHCPPMGNCPNDGLLGG